MVKYHALFILDCFISICNYGYQYSLQQIINQILRGKMPYNFILLVIFLKQIKPTIITSRIIFTLFKLHANNFNLNNLNPISSSLSK